MRLVLLDRDGVLNQDRPLSVRSPDELRLIPAAASAVARLNSAGIPVAVVTNQSVVGRGLITGHELDAIHDRLRGELAAAGAWLDLILVAPEPPGAPASRRKPAPAMLLEASAHFAVPPCEAVMIGDDLRDLEAALAAGCRRVLVRTGKGAAIAAKGLPPHLEPVMLARDLQDAVDTLLTEAA